MSLLSALKISPQNKEFSILPVWNVILSHILIILNVFFKENNIFCKWVLLFCVEITAFIL
jgi:hypothetical protein